MSTPKPFAEPTTLATCQDAPVVEFGPTRPPPPPPPGSVAYYDECQWEGCCGIAEHYVADRGGAWWNVCAEHHAAGESQNFWRKERA